MLRERYEVLRNTFEDANVASMIEKDVSFLEAMDKTFTRVWDANQIPRNYPAPKAWFNLEKQEINMKEVSMVLECYPPRYVFQTETMAFEPMNYCCLKVEGKELKFAKDLASFEFEGRKFST